MLECEMNQYTLPTISFVGGETQDLAFNVYFYKNKKPYGLSGCTANFAIVHFLNKAGTPILSKPMASRINEAGTIDNVLTITLAPEDTVDLSGKYIYQISIRDIGGDAEIPKQGILMISTNIDKGFIRKQ